MAAGRSVANHGHKAQPFRCHDLIIVIVLLKGSSLLTPVKRAEGPKLHFCFCRPPFLISLSNLLYLGTTRKLLHAK